MELWGPVVVMLILSSNLTGGARILKKDCCLSG